MVILIKSGRYWVTRLAFACPFLLTMLFDILGNQRRLDSLPDYWSFQGIQKGAALAALNPDLLAHYPQYFTSIISMVIIAIINPLENMTLLGVWSLWLSFIVAFVLCISFLIGYIAERNILPIWLIFSVAAVAATMSSMIRGYPLMSGHYITGVTLVASALLLYLAVKSKFQDATVAKWLFLLTGFAAGLHFGTIFVILTVAGAYIYQAAGQKKIQLFPIEPSKKIHGKIIEIAIIFASIAVFGQLLNIIYSQFNRLSIAMAILSVLAIATYFWLNKFNIKRICFHIAIAGTFQTAFYVLVKWLQVHNNAPSIILPHVVLATFPTLIFYFAVNSKTWFTELSHGTIGLTALGMFVSASYGTPFILDGIRSAGHNFKGNGFGNISDIGSGIMCTHHWEAVAIIFTVSILLFVLGKPSTSSNIRILCGAAIVAFILYLLAVLPGSCTLPNEGIYFGFGSRAFLIILFFTSLALVMTLEYSSVGRVIGVILAAIICMFGINDIASAEWRTHIRNINKSHIAARNILRKELKDQRTELLCNSRALDECILVCEFFAVSFTHPLDINRQKQIASSKNLGKGNIVNLDRVRCINDRIYTSSQLSRYLIISDSPLEKSNIDYSKLIWSSPPYTYIYATKKTPSE